MAIRSLRALGVAWLFGALVAATVLWLVPSMFLRSSLFEVAAIIGQGALPGTVAEPEWMLRARYAADALVCGGWAWYLERIERAGPEETILPKLACVLSLAASAGSWCEALFR